jgi:alpha-tubulin suppressor-like RCC1 family protein
MQTVAIASEPSVGARRRTGPFVVLFAFTLIGGLFAVGAPAASAARATSVTVGGFHTCVVTDRGGVKCWGWNAHGELGDGTLIDRLTPVDVVGLTSGVVAITAGESFTCALTAAGAVQCWGQDRYGQLGDGRTRARRVPVDVVGLSSGVAAISAGAEHACALTDTGGVLCWGRNRDGQLGDGTRQVRLTPTPAAGLTSGVAEVSAGKYHSCALTDAGDVKCWGYNEEGQLGDGTRHDRATATRVKGLSGVAEVSAGGFHTCALAVSGTVTCWGSNRTGQLGDGTDIRRLTPVTVHHLKDAIAVTAGGAHSCAITSTHGARCWGENRSLQLGDGTTSNRRSPVGVVGLRGVSEIAASYSHSCAVTMSGRAACWGTNHYGKLGDGTQYGRLIPISVRGIAGDRGAYRADASIAKPSPAQWVGDDVIDPTGKTERISINVHPAGSARARVRLQNDGDARDQFFLEGSSGRGGFTVGYRSASEDITRAVTGCRFWVATAPGSAYPLSIRVGVGSSVPVGAHILVLLRARSAHDSGSIDAVRLSIEAA